MGGKKKKKKEERWRGDRRQPKVCNCAGLKWDGVGLCLLRGLVQTRELCLHPSTVPPLPSLIPGPPLEEGQGLTLAASCTAEGSPAPQVSWDTEVKGTPSSRSFTHSRSAAVTSEFHLVPSRSMNGQPLTCVVSHPGLLQDQRITHTLQVACEYLDAWVDRPHGLPKGW